MMSPVMVQKMTQFGMSYEKLNETVSNEAKDNIFLSYKKVETSSVYGSHRTLSARQDYNPEDESYSAIDQFIRTETLSEHLTRQCELESLSEKDTMILERLIEGLDQRGYFNQYDNLRANIVSELSVAPRKVNEMLKVLQTFEPEGVGARDLKECLLIQVREVNFESEEIRTVLSLIIKDHLEDLANKDYEKISLKTGLKKEGVLDIASYIKDHLNPNPASEFKHDQFTHHIVPSFRCAVLDGQVSFENLEVEKGFKVSLSEDALKELSNPNLDDASKVFLSKQLDAAKELIKNVEQRKENLNQLMSIIITKQTPFFIKGEAFLEPLLQKNLANDLGMAPSTISRILSSKYVETPHGVIPLRNLCPRDHFGRTAHRLQEMVSYYCETFPNLSDAKIATLLKRDHSIMIARRTVTKYRLLAGQSSSLIRGKS